VLACARVFEGRGSGDIATSSFRTGFMPIRRNPLSLLDSTAIQIPAANLSVLLFSVNEDWTLNRRGEPSFSGDLVERSMLGRNGLANESLGSGKGKLGALGERHARPLRRSFASALPRRDADDAAYRARASHGRRSGMEIIASVYEFVGVWRSNARSSVLIRT
jgi:hypothetical protein